MSGPLKLTLAEAVQHQRVRAELDALRTALERLADGWENCARYAETILPEVQLGEPAAFRACARELRALAREAR